jgi:lambda family phage tail tape measure protein
LDRGLSNGLRKAFDGLAFDGLKLSDALSMVARNMIDTTYAAAIKPVANGFGSAIADGISGLVAGVMPFKDGTTFSQGRVMPFALGGVVSGATTFPMRGGTGLMGEAGPEAIMPLSRGADGRLGVRTQGGGGVNVTMNISTPDVRGFERSQGQIAARVARAIGQGNRNR